MQFTHAVAPESIGRQFIRSLSLYFKSFIHVFLFALVLSIIAFTPRIVTALTGHDAVFDPSPFTREKILFLLIDVCSLILFTAMLWRIKCLIIGKHETILEDFKTALKKTPYILVAVILQGLVFLLVNIVSLGLYLLAGPTALSSTLNYWIIGSTFILQFFAIIYIYFLFYFYLALILTEDKNALSSLKKSVALVWKNWWRTCILQVLPWICYFIVLVIIREIFQFNIHIYFFEPLRPDLFSISLQIVIFALFLPWPAATLLVQLRDLELRKNYY